MSSFASQSDAYLIEIYNGWVKKLLLALLIFALAFGGYWVFKPKSKGRTIGESKARQQVLAVGLVADPENENELLAKSLAQLKSANVNFVIALGDLTNTGTVDELQASKAVFDNGGLPYYVMPGDHDGWESREKGEANSANFTSVFGKPTTQFFDKDGIRFVLVDNSDLYKGISAEDWEILRRGTSLPEAPQGRTSSLTFVFAHKTPFHPDSAHIMGEDSPAVAVQAKDFLALLEDSKVDGFFSGDLHFFARFNSPSGSVKISTIGAVASQKNFQGPRFSILRIWDDKSWDVEDIEIK